MRSSLLCLVGIRLFSLVIARDAMASALIDIECANLTFLKPKIILLMKKGEWPEDNDNAKSWVHCVLVKNNVMTKRGDLRQENLLALDDLSEAEAAKKHEIIDKCMPSNYTRITPRDISWQFAKCYQREDPENSLF